MPVQAATGALKASARGEKAQLRGVDTDIPRVTGRHIAMLPSGKFNQPDPRWPCAQSDRIDTIAHTLTIRSLAKAGHRCLCALHREAAVVVQAFGVGQGVGVGDHGRVGALQDVLDGYFEFLARPRPWNGWGGDDLVGHVSW